MNTRFTVGIGGIGVLAALAVASLRYLSPATADFTFPVSDGTGTMTYRCQMAETLAETERNARAAHGFFELALSEAARLQAEAMAESMVPGRASSDIVAELDVINAEAYANRKAVHRDLQQRFRCQYRGST